MKSLSVTVAVMAFELVASLGLLICGWPGYFCASVPGLQGTVAAFIGLPHLRSRSAVVDSKFILPPVRALNVVMHLQTVIAFGAVVSIALCIVAFLFPMNLGVPTWLATWLFPMSGVALGCATVLFGCSTVLRFWIPDIIADVCLDAALNRCRRVPSSLPIRVRRRSESIGAPSAAAGGEVVHPTTAPKENVLLRAFGGQPVHQPLPAMAQHPSPQLDMPLLTDEDSLLTK